MTRLQELKNSTPIDKFNQKLEQLAENDRNKDIYYAIKSWCEELSFSSEEKEKIIDYFKNWLKQDLVVRKSLKIYQKFIVKTDKKTHFF